MWLIVYSNDDASLTVRPIYSSSKLRTAQMMIFALVAMIGLEKCCIRSACLQWLCHSGERTVARGPLVMYFCIREASGPRVKLASCKSALNPPVVCSTDRSKAVVPVLVLLFVALWFILRGSLLYVFPCVILFLCFSVLLVLRLPRLGKRELILVLFVRLFGLCLFRFVGFLFLLGSGKGCGLWLWHSLDFSLTFFF